MSAPTNADVRTALIAYLGDAQPLLDWYAGDNPQGEIISGPDVGEWQFAGPVADYAIRIQDNGVVPEDMWPKPGCPHYMAFFTVWVWTAGVGTTMAHSLIGVVEEVLRDCVSVKEVYGPRKVCLQDIVWLGREEAVPSREGWSMPTRFRATVKYV